MDKQGNALARQMFKEAIALDPEYAIAYSYQKIYPPFIHCAVIIVLVYGQ